ncbi:uncharacterized protein L3040_003056 [Drepanopeziza brunnea f. sp. 'multigermtubi']|uniref:BTB domain-containing protein n=1 Tax=Marssonina brunnea f. sp. multigermtubi (strain MB_m1) TaxID=1072389 RepID=K1WLU5_MARBU|nr:uncharacterized protein MBM_08700 [Drepanopeziza brunnea f. sp. 'multigermtubi' MB_m1]EKD13257.1 hypothetical protein MBM_08700 [Drepanopeziza brunnea f. sp. 'multigermtubi' MB_m1]KAJ5047215.1 hypothetical protein L3040_003056 [Drepanopeziza brunnea f. sp. 'multigermtubi']
MSSPNLIPFERAAKGLRKPVMDFTKPSPLVTFTIGKAGQEEVFSIHKRQIEIHAPVVAMVLLQDSLQLRLCDVEVQVFGMMAHWFYAQEVSLAVLDRNKKSKKLLATHLLPLAKLYNLANVFVMPALQNAVMDSLVPMLDKTNVATISEFAMRVYLDGKAAGTPMRALAIYYAAQSFTPEVLAAIQETAPRDLLFDMSMAYIRHNDLVHNSNLYHLTDPTKFYLKVDGVALDMFNDEEDEHGFERFDEYEEIQELGYDEDGEKETAADTIQTSDHGSERQFGEDFEIARVKNSKVSTKFLGYMEGDDGEEITVWME